MIDTEALRKKVIDLAIQGKLTEQLPSDGDAESLYAKIQEEKAKLIKEGKTKKEKQLPTISDNEKLFDIPANWKWVHLNNIATSSLGKTLNKSTDKGDEVPYLCSINVHWEGIKLDLVKKAKFDEVSKLNYRLQKGDLLICEGGDSGRSAIWNHDEEMYYQNALHRVRFYGKIKPEFFCLVLECYKKAGIINRYTTGIGIQHLVQSSLNAMWLPLPPLAEQKRIVEKLDTVLAQIDIIDTLQQQYASDLSVLKGKIIDAGIRGKLTEQLPEDGDAEILYLQIQEEKAKLINEDKIKKEKPLPDINADEIPFEIPKNWKWVRLGTCISLLSGQDYKPEDYNDEAKGMPYMTGASNIVDGRLAVNRWTICPKNISHNGDLLLVCKGSGYGKIVFNEVGDVHIARQFMAISAYHDIDINYIAYILQWNIDMIRERGQGLIPGIDRSSVLGLLLPLPPYVEQIRISSRIGELLKVIS